MSDNKELSIKVKLQADTASVKQTSKEIGSALESQSEQFVNKTKKYIDELNKYKIQVDWQGQEQMFLNASKISKENDEKSLDFFKETYQEKLQFAKEIDKKIAEESKAKEAEIEKQKSSDREKMMDKHYAAEQKKYNNYKREQDRQKKEQEKQEDEIIQKSFKKTVEGRNQVDKDRRFRWTVREKEEEQEQRKKADLKKRFKFYGAGVGSAIGGAVGGRVGGAAGGFIGAALTGGDIGGGALGLAITALTAVITHLTDVLEEDTDTGYLANAIHADPNKLNAMIKAGEVMHIKKEETLGGVKTISSGIAGLNIQPNGTYGRMNEAGQTLAMNAAKLHIPLTSKGKARDPLDIYMDFMNAPENSDVFKKEGLTQDTANLVVSQYLGFPYEKMQQGKNKEYQGYFNEFMKDMPLTQEDVKTETALDQQAKLKLKKLGYKTGRPVIRGGEKAGNYFMNRYGTGANLYTMPPQNPTRVYDSVNNYLMSDEARRRQAMAESSGNPNATHVNADGSVDVGLYGINMKTANSEATKKHFGHGATMEQLKDPKINQQYRDFLVQDGMNYIRSHYPDLMGNPNQLLKAEYAYYNGGSDNLKQWYATGQSNNDDYINKNTQNIVINIDARGNSNAKDIGDQVQKKLAPYNSQTSVK